MKVQVQRLPHARDLPLPGYANAGDAGLDIHAAEEKALKAGETATVKTGLCMAIPEGCVGLIWDRSGLAARDAVHTLAGVVDAGYRGEIQVVLRNAGGREFAITRGMRIAQLLIQPVVKAELEESPSLEKTARNEGGFGSSGR